MSDHPICARRVIFIGPFCSISLRHTLGLSDPMTASDPGIPPAPPDTVGQVGEVLLGGCPGSGMREMGIPCECRGHIDQALALGSRQRTGYWECGRGMGRVVMAPRGSLSHGAVDTCLAHLLSKCPLSLPHFSPPKKAHSPGLSGRAPMPFVIPLQLRSLTPIVGHQLHRLPDQRMTHAQHRSPDSRKPHPHR